MSLIGHTHSVNVSTDVAEIVDREWLLTNGTGAYAMGTVAGINTRRYHGLFVAATQPPVGRAVVLNQMFEQLVMANPGGDQMINLSACAFRDPHGGKVFAPNGHQLLQHFEKGLSVSWTYLAGQVKFIRTLYLHWKQQAVTIQYLVSGLTAPMALRLGPMLTLRDFHSLVKSQSSVPKVSVSGDTITVTKDSVSTTLRCEGAEVQTLGEDDQWWYRVYYEEEEARGQEDEEDYYLPARFVVPLAAGAPQEVTLTVALGDSPAEPATTTKPRESHLAPIIDHLSGVIGDCPVLAGKGPRLFAVAADDFVVDRTIGGEQLTTILAGYPWFADWGRDTFIALPGLLLATGRFEQARLTLRTYARSIQGGLVPNRFDDYDHKAAHYNTVDASLWFIHAAMAYLQATGDHDTWNDWLADAAIDIIKAHIKGVALGGEIRMAGDGLITAGTANSQLTWMDAARDGVIFTPRQGKAVEINALWFHALAGMSELIGQTHEDAADHYRKLVARIRRSYSKVFWDDELNYLRDHVWVDGEGNEHANRTLRANQIFAASLAHSPLPRTKQRQVVAAVREALLTPFGLRTLGPDHPHYHGRYTGSMFDRDQAYHQGTVWPWLIGAYAEAVLRVGRFSDPARAEALEVITPLLAELAGRGLGQLHEIHEGDPPHLPVGCIAQAWSVAEVLRVLSLIQGS